MRRALILCPATVLSHWMAELHVWAPQLRVVILHRCVQAFNAASGSSGDKRIVLDLHAIVNLVGVREKSIKATYVACLCGRHTPQQSITPCVSCDQENFEPWYDEFSGGLMSSW